MDRRAVMAIVNKDLTAVIRNRGVRTPLIVAPILLLVVLPILLVGGSGALEAGGLAELTTEAAPIAGGASGDAADDLIASRNLTAEGAYAVFVLEVFLAPLFLLVPLITATVVAADSFAGERERGTLEALLHTPTTDRELMVAKFLSAWSPAVLVALVGFGVYSVLANLLSAGAVGGWWFPTPTWIILGVFVTPGVAALGLGVMVIASSRVQSLQAAHQVGSLMVLPILVLLIAQVTGALFLSTRVVVILGALIWLVAILAVALGSASLKRQALALRL